MSKIEIKLNHEVGTNNVIVTGLVGDGCYFTRANTLDLQRDAAKTIKLAATQLWLEECDEVEEPQPLSAWLAAVNEAIRVNINKTRRDLIL